MGRRRAQGSGSLGRVLIRHQTQRNRSHRHTDSWVRKSLLSVSFPSRSGSLTLQKLEQSHAEQNVEAGPSKAQGTEGLACDEMGIKTYTGFYVGMLACV